MTFNMNLLDFDTIRTINAAARAELATEDAAPKGTPKQRAVSTAYYNGNWGCQKQSVKKVLEALMGSPLLPPPPSLKVPLKPGLILNYGGNLVLVHYLDKAGDAFFLTADGSESVDGETYITETEEYSLATAEEVDTFLTETCINRNA